ncbi:hypothetical protein [Paraburkholderia phenoliruptrix]|uniref:hypothetical protein n=1 Tax=Paraburkholderia phenoliruptrix TaxID=252970 RepID=UPI001C4E56B6|nr:hypothetical protein [Paraburkholderia phenoliruptrix]MBW0450880.1 hypothetical protein [Paraburkholderia phenoliruptrix]MBW9100973.1 hypothetical protein [Paraburkholderia phenoliruptrix]
MQKWLWSYCSAVLVVGAVIAVQNIWCLSKSDWASWVQAVGSIAAIIGAYIVGERQSRAAVESVREAHRITEASRQASMFAVIKAAHNRAQLIRDALDDEMPPLKLIAVYHPSIIDSLLASMSALNVAEIGSDEAVGAFVIFSGQFVFLRDALEKHLAGPSRDESVMKSIEKLKERGYGPRHTEQVWETAVDVKKKNVLVHLNQIDLEFHTLSEHFLRRELDRRS